MHIYYEGSPNLGYASAAQIVECVARVLEHDDSERLFPVHDPAKVQRLGQKVFKQMARGIGTFRPQLEDRYVFYHNDDALGTDTYELGVESDDPELGTLINLDSLDASLSDQFGAWDLPKPHYTRQVEPIATQFLEQRKQILGIRQESSL
jgi:hypothetical protein